MSIRLDLDRALAGANIPAEDIRPTQARLLDGSHIGTIFTFGFNMLSEGLGFNARMTRTPLLEDSRSYAIFQRARGDFDAAQPTVNQILAITDQLRRNTEILHKEIEFQNSLSVKSGRYALNAISVCAAGCGIGLLQRVPLFSAEGGTIAAGAIAGIAVPQAIKNRYFPDLTASIQARTVAIENSTQELNRLWVQLEGADLTYPHENLLQAGLDLQLQVEENSRTYKHLKNRFSVANPDPMPAIEDAPAERAQ